MLQLLFLFFSSIFYIKTNDRESFLQNLQRELESEELKLRFLKQKNIECEEELKEAQNELGYQIRSRINTLNKIGNIETKVGELKIQIVNEKNESEKKNKENQVSLLEGELPLFRSESMNIQNSIDFYRPKAQELRSKSTELETQIDSQEEVIKKKKNQIERIESLRSFNN